MRMTRTVAVVVGGLMLATAAGAQEQVETVAKKAAMKAPTFTDVTDDMLKNARTDWQELADLRARLHESALVAARRRSTAPTSAALRAAWIYQTGISRLGSFETSPIVVRRHVPDDAVQHRDRGGECSNGKEIWRYEHKPSITLPIYCCGPNNRGVAISGGTVYQGDARCAPGGARREDRRGAVGR